LVGKRGQFSTGIFTWYKDIRYLGLIIAIIFILVTIIIWLWPIPPPPISIDPMESTRNWYTSKDDHGSSINRKSITGRTGNGIEITYGLKSSDTQLYLLDPEVLLSGFLVILNREFGSFGMVLLESTQKIAWNGG